jgi:hypothetical protein
MDALFHETSVRYDFDAGCLMLDTGFGCSMLDSWRLPVSFRGFVSSCETIVILQQCPHMEGRRLSARFGRGARDPPAMQKRIGIYSQPKGA